ncbi:murein peptide amidase A [Mariprofundus sp. NF]|uniref:M14 family murein peptide amidase A n=1 Tax=Mariprofundus sp. NF TaxID=2608716 RepID=UPI00182372AF|nr:M14 family murein peptide amidase A [Mariprofundus sp. NF]NWF39668.1 murein peptide amidase A [Mariprofundus sp. NF]
MSVKTGAINRRLAGCEPTAIVAPMLHLLPSITALFFAALLLFPEALVAADANSVEKPSAIEKECKRIGNKLGSVSIRDCLNHNLQESGAQSVTGQAIMLKEYPPLASREPKARILLIGGTHGDEYSSVSIIFKWMKTLDIHHSGLFHWHVSPLVNPDGLLQRPSQRLNANGVDLNRNMPTPDWHKSTSAYWQKTGFDKRRYPGPAPLSEPESRWLYEEIRTFKPHAIVSVHAPYGVLDFDGPPVGPNQLGQLHLHLIGTYPGSLGNSAGVQHQIPVITVELPYAGIMPSEDEISRMWMDLIRWLRLNVPKEKTTKAYATFDETSRQLMAAPASGKEQQRERPAAEVTPDSSVEEKGSEIHMNSRIDN